MNILFKLETEDGSPITYKELFKISAYHNIPYVLIAYDEDKKHLELPEKTAYIEDVYLVSNEDVMHHLEEVLCGGGHCFTYQLINGEYK
jgi:hypothetical protein